MHIHYHYPRPEPFSPYPPGGQVPDYAKWMKDQLALKQDKLTFDILPVESSLNPVTSGGIYLALAAKASLVNGKVPAEQLPSYVDDVLEFASREAFPNPGESGILYVARDQNLVYRWSGTDYVAVVSRIDIDTVVTRLSSNPVASLGIWAAIWGSLNATPAGYTSLYDWTLGTRASKTDVTLTDKYSDWVVSFQLTDEQKETFQEYGPEEAAEDDFALTIRNGTTLYVGNYNAAAGSPSEDGLSLLLTGGDARLGLQVGDTMATRTLIGYQLGSQDDRLLQPQGDYLSRNEVVAPSNTAVTGQAADAKATYDQLKEKVNKDNAKVYGSLTIGPHDSTTDSAVGFVGETVSVTTPDPTTQTFNHRTLTWPAATGTLTTEERVAAIVNALKNGAFRIVATLPATGEAMVIYLVAKEDSETGDVYDEYIWVDGAWEHIGSTQIDLSDYYTKTQTDNLLAQKLDKSGGTVTGSLSISNATFSVFKSDGNIVAVGGWNSDHEAYWLYLRLTGDKWALCHRDASGEDVPGEYVNTLPRASGTLALTAPNPTAGRLAALDANGNPIDSGKAPADFAPATNIPKAALASAVQASLDKADGAATKADATLTPVYSDTPTFTEWVCDPAFPTDPGGNPLTINSITYQSGYWVLNTTPYGNIDATQGAETDTTIVFSNLGYHTQAITATRTRTDIIGYTLGSQTAKPLQPAGDYAPLASPAFTGAPTAPTPASGDNTTKVATTAFVQAAVAGATPNLDYVMRVDPETGGIYYTTPDNA